MTRSPGFVCTVNMEPYAYSVNIRSGEDLPPRRPAGGPGRGGPGPAGGRRRGGAVAARGGPGLRGLRDGALPPLSPARRISWRRSPPGASPISRPGWRRPTPPREGAQALAAQGAAYVTFACRHPALFRLMFMRPCRGPVGSEAYRILERRAAALAGPAMPRRGPDARRLVAGARPRRADPRPPGAPGGRGRGGPGPADHPGLRRPVDGGGLSHASASTTARGGGSLARSSRVTAGAATTVPRLA